MLSILHRDSRISFDLTGGSRISLDLTGGRSLLDITGGLGSLGSEREPMPAPLLSVTLTLFQAGIRPILLRLGRFFSVSTGSVRFGRFSPFRPVQSGLHLYRLVHADTGPVQAGSLLFQAGIRPIHTDSGQFLLFCRFHQILGPSATGP